MKQYFATSKAKGFTLVELLIVIIIIGILSGMLLLAVGSATDKAEATKIVNALRSYKSATIMYYTDNGRWPTPDTGWQGSLDKYTDRSLDTGVFSTVEVAQVTGSDRLLIGLIGASGAPLTQDGVKEKLQAQARASALYNRAGADFIKVAGADEIFTNMR